MNNEANSPRKLASIQVVDSLAPITGADAIVKATVLGWAVVVKKGEFQPGDRCIYCEIDSVLPERPEFEFLRPRHFRIRTARLRGQVSQGICFPLSILPGAESLPVGEDVTGRLGVTKYEPPIPVDLAGDAIGRLPGDLPKTDEPRIQSVPGVLARHAGEDFVTTEKLDGTSLTAYWRHGHFGVCSRNFELRETPESTHWQAARALGLEEKLAVLVNLLGGEAAIQAELCGPRIQGNKLRLDRYRCFVFNLIDPRKRAFVPTLEAMPLLTDEGFDTVPLVLERQPLPPTVDELVRLATRKSKLADTWAEGLVFRAVAEGRDEEIGRLSFKVINPEFLLEHGE